MAMKHRGTGIYLEDRKTAIKLLGRGRYLRLLNKKEFEFLPKEEKEKEKEK